jgi:hypothetical protein
MILGGNKTKVIVALLASIDEKLEKICAGQDKVIESNREFINTLIHFLASEEKLRKRDMDLLEIREKNREETPWDRRY